MSWRDRLISRVTPLLVCITISWVMIGCASGPSTEKLVGETLSGRLAIRIEADGDTPAHAINASFELQGTPSAGRLNLSTPLGSVLAQARWSPRSTVLATSQGDRRFDSLDALTHEILGESVPVAALFDWLNGRPWPDASSSKTANGFEQLGWIVDLTHFDESTVTASRERAPAVNVRVKVDQP